MNYSTNLFRLKLIHGYPKSETTNSSNKKKSISILSLTFCAMLFFSNLNSQNNNTYIDFYNKEIIYHKYNKKGKINETLSYTVTKKNETLNEVFVKYLKGSSRKKNNFSYLIECNSDYYSISGNILNVIKNHKDFKGVKFKTDLESKILYPTKLLDFEKSSKLILEYPVLPNYSFTSESVVNELNFEIITSINSLSRKILGSRTFDSPFGFIECIEIQTISELKIKTNGINIPPIKTKHIEYFSPELELIVMTQDFNKKGKIQSYLKMEGLESLDDCGFPRYYGAIKIVSKDCGFVKKTRENLNQVYHTNLGKRLLKFIKDDKSCLSTFSIWLRPTSNGESPNYQYRASGHNLYWDPEYKGPRLYKTEYRESKEEYDNWSTKAPAYIYLFHELTHYWIIEYKGLELTDKNIKQSEYMATGLGEYYRTLNYNENKLRNELNIPLRSRYGDWYNHPKHPTKLPKF